jgi:hypothetical protein
MDSILKRHHQEFPPVQKAVLPPTTPPGLHGDLASSRSSFWNQCALIAFRTPNVCADVQGDTLGIAVDPPYETAAAELRSDGVLRVPNNPALSRGDGGATDLYRDFALCRLFLRHGWEPLHSAGAPRWSIRAARLGCQTALPEREVVGSGHQRHSRPMP